MKTLFPAFLSLALLAPAAQGQTDSLAARRDTVVPGAARLAAARTIPELLAARVPGLQVRPGSGAVASGSRLRLRGASGILLPGEPLVVVDGVFVVSEANDRLAEVDQAPSRLDDFLPDDIERVEVLSGPVAIARYGPDGVHGAVEVYTRQGTAGRPRFHGFAEAGARSDVAAYPASYGREGVESGGTRTTACTLGLQASGRCTPLGDSLLSFNPLEAASPFRTGGTRRVGGSVSGGLGPLAFSAGGSAERDLGVLRRDSRERTGARGSFTLRPGFGVEVAGSALHLRNTLELPLEGATPFGTLFNGLGGHAFDDPVRRGYLDLTQAQRDTLGVTQTARRTLAVASVRWSALRWLTVGGRYGIDDVAAEDVPHYHYDDPRFRPVSQTLESERTRRNADVFARAEYAPAGGLLLATTLGAERWSARLHTLEEVAYELGFLSEELARRNRSTAFFARQELAWGGRLSGTLSVRRDEPLAWPDPLVSGGASAAWEVGRERFFPRPRWLDGLRLRAAYARTDQDPENAFAAVNFIPICGPGGCGGEDRIVPQRHAEAEGGVDATFLAGRMELSLTGYRRRTDDVLAFVPTQFGSSVFNSGRVVNRGVEARLRVGAPAGAPLFWELAGTGAVNRNRLEDYDGPRILPGPGQISTDGNPVGSFFGPRITSFQDRNGDGIIGRVGCSNTGNQPACEIQYDEAEYLGPADPTRMLGVHGRVGWRGVEISALLDHQGGMRRANQLDRQRCSFLLTCQAAFDPSTPLEDQARVVAYGLVPGFTHVEDATFTRLREAAVTLSIPERWARRFGGRGAEITLAGRNLATWTPYSGLDPETNSSAQDPILFGEWFTQPLPRTLTTRLDVRF